jgi:TRAP-type C4-dicarboxylate transport system substrate-binding protein
MKLGLMIPTVKQAGAREAMLNCLLRCAIALSLLCPAAASCEPIRLKFSFFSSDRTVLYRAAVKPFVDAVNAEAKGLLEIDVYFSGALGKDLSKQSQMVLDGVADLAYVIPGMTADRFADNAVIELPGLYRDVREATLVFSGLVAAQRLRGYEDFVVIGAFATEPESIHIRPSIAGLSDLRDKRIRVNNAFEAAALEKLGMHPALMPINAAAEAISSGVIDAATLPTAPMPEFGIGRVATNHYMLRTSAIPLLVVMNRSKFASLPDYAKAIVRKYSGDWAVEHFIDVFQTRTDEVMDQLNADPQRKVIVPSSADLKKAQIAFDSVVRDFAAKQPDKTLLSAVRTKVEELRASD